MLKLSMTPGEYVKIGDDIVVELTRVGDGRAYLGFGAPRQTPILRGTVLEREGGERPDDLIPVYK